MNELKLAIQETIKDIEKGIYLSYPAYDFKPVLREWNMCNLLIKYLTNDYAMLIKKGEIKGNQDNINIALCGIRKVDLRAVHIIRLVSCMQHSQIEIVNSIQTDLGTKIWTKWATEHNDGFKSIRGWYLYFLDELLKHYREHNHFYDVWINL